jgi:hypothetical protein
MGYSVTAGDFNGDGRDDVAVGIPFAEVGVAVDAGAVAVLYGSSDGISGTGSQFWTQDSPGVLGGSESHDHFGRALAAGDFNGDGRDELALGAANESVSGAFNAGAVNVLIGSAGGLTATGNQVWTQDAIGGSQSSEDYDHFGFSLTAADANDDNRDDLAIGAHGEDLGAGIVHVLFGTASGLGTLGNINLTQEAVGGLSENNDHFGESLATGDFNGDDRFDLIAAAPSEGIGAATKAGTVYVVYGGIAFSGGEEWNQNTSGILDAAETDDLFGLGLDAGGGRSAGDGFGGHNLAQLVTADFEPDSPLNKHNKRRLLSCRR